MNIYLKPQKEIYSMKYISNNTSKRSISNLKKAPLNLNDLINSKKNNNNFKNRKSSLKLGKDSINFLLPSKREIHPKQNHEKKLENSNPKRRKRTQSVSTLQKNRKKSKSRSVKKSNSKAPINIYQTMKKLDIQKSQIGNFIIDNKKKYYSVNTINGLLRDYNEDRVSILTNIKKKCGWKDSDWPKMSYFGIFDGHGGDKCSDYLKLNLHANIYNSVYFPMDMKKAIIEGCKKTELDFLNLAKKKKEKSGSCGIIIYIIKKTVYAGNIGDSRLIVSEKKGKKMKQITIDHKPFKEKARIIKHGGVVKRHESYSMVRSTSKAKKKKSKKKPYRLYPGGLSVSRSFGDVMVKEEDLGGKSGVLVADPEVFVYRIRKDTDFLFLGCDGIFDKVSNEEIGEYFWDYLRFNKGLKRRGKLEGIVNFIFEECMKTKSCDNLTGIFLPIADYVLSK